MWFEKRLLAVVRRVHDVYEAARQEDQPVEEVERVRHAEQHRAAGAHDAPDLGHEPPRREHVLDDVVAEGYVELAVAEGEAIGLQVDRAPLDPPLDEGRGGVGRHFHAAQPAARRAEGLEHEALAAAHVEDRARRGDLGEAPREVDLPAQVLGQPELLAAPVALVVRLAIAAGDCCRGVHPHLAHEHQTTGYGVPSEAHDHGVARGPGRRPGGPRGDPRLRRRDADLAAPRRVRGELPLRRRPDPGTSAALRRPPRRCLRVRAGTVALLRPLRAFLGRAPVARPRGVGALRRALRLAGALARSPRGPGRRGPEGAAGRDRPGRRVRREPVPAGAVRGVGAAGRRRGRAGRRGPVPLRSSRSRRRPGGRALRPVALLQAERLRRGARGDPCRRAPAPFARVAGRGRGVVLPRRVRRHAPGGQRGRVGRAPRRLDSYAAQPRTLGRADGVTGAVLRRTARGVCVVGARGKGLDGGVGARRQHRVGASLDREGREREQLLDGAVRGRSRSCSRTVPLPSLPASLVRGAAGVPGDRPVPLDRVWPRCEALPRRCRRRARRPPPSRPSATGARRGPATSSSPTRRASSRPSTAGSSTSP